MRHAMAGETVEAGRARGASAVAVCGGLWPVQGVELRAQMAALVGHQNHKQKIQHTMRIKQENTNLRNERDRMAEDLASHNRLILRLRLELDRTQRRLTGQLEHLVLAIWREQ